MILLNFSHPLTEQQREQVETLAALPIEQVLEIPVQFNPEEPYPPQAAALVAGVGLTAREWQTLPLLVNLPGHSAIAALVLAEIHGRVGHFPGIVRMRPAAGATPPRYEAAEILNLQQIRDAARTSR